MTKSQIPWTVTDGGKPVVHGPGKVLIVLPDDAHKVKIALDGPERVEKAVVKVRMK